MSEDIKEKTRPATGFHTNPERINRNGRPKNEDSPTYWLRRFLTEVDPKSPGGKIRIRELAEKLALMAYQGDLSAMKEIFDRLEGKPMQPTEVTIKEPPIPILSKDEISRDDSPQENTESNQED